MIMSFINFYSKGDFMHNSNYRAEQYRDLRRRMNEMNTPMKNSCMRGACGMENQTTNRTPCNPEGDDRGNGWGLYEYPLAMAYAPYQVWRSTYCEDNALEKGTLFSELDLPFEGCGK